MRRRTAGSDEGAAAVEFALISVVLFTLLFGIVQYGFYFLQVTSITALAGHAGREASLRDGCDDWEERVEAQVEVLANGAAVQEVSLGPTDVGTSIPTRRGDQEVITVLWDPTRVGVVPFPVGDFRERTVVRYERLDVEADPVCRWVPTEPSP